MLHREEPYVTDDLKRFIEGFDNEDALRRAVEALLMKMPGCTNVRAHHGPLEQGKDIRQWSLAFLVAQAGNTGF